MSDNTTVDITSRNGRGTKWLSGNVPVLIGCSTSTSKESVVLSHSEFVIGRGLAASYIIAHAGISNLHCVFRLCGEKWTVSDMSERGTSVNNKRIEKNKPTYLLDGDEIRFGLSDARYTFFMSADSMVPPNKKPRLNQDLEQPKQELPKGMKKTVQSKTSVTDHKKNEIGIAKVWQWLSTYTVDNMQQSEKAEEVKPPETKRDEEMRLSKEVKFFSPEVHQSAKEQEKRVKVNKVHQLTKEQKEKVKGDKANQSTKEQKGKVKGDKANQSTKEQKGKVKASAKEQKGKVKGDKPKLMKKSDKAKEIKLLEAKNIKAMKQCIKGKLAKENRKLEKQLQEMQQKLIEKEEQRLRDLEQQDAKNKVLLQALTAEIAAKEEAVRSQLEAEIKKLRSEKEKIENNIRYELLIKEDESAKKIEKLTEELDKVKAELANTEGKKQCLVKELEDSASRTQEQLSESILKAKQEILHNIEQLIESELQCSICNELFVKPITLNCTHTFCHMCISHWKQKKEDCPVCRAPITSEIRSVVLDTFIDKAVESLSRELQNKRQAVVEERPVQELHPGNEASTSNQGKRGRSANGHRSNESVVTISDSSSDSEVDLESPLESDADSSSTSSSYEHYFGEHGFCLGCGRNGHWGGACSYRL